VVAISFVATSWGFLTPLSLIVGIILGCVAIWQKLQSVRRRLTVHVVRHNFRMPLKPRDLLTSYEDKVRDVLEDVDNGYSLRRQITDLLNADENLNLGSVGAALAYARSYWELQIENLARTKAVGVTVTFPRHGFIVAEVNRGDSKEVIRRDDGKLPIGDLIPRDAVTVRAWSSDDHWFDPIEAVTVAHDSGVARTRRQYLVNRGWYKFAQFFSAIGWFLVVLCVSWALLMLGAYFATKLQNTSATHLAAPTTVTATPPSPRTSPTP
jgi:hypothetical protein